MPDSLCQDLRAVEVAPIGDDFEAFRFQRRLHFLGHARELGPVGPDVCHLVRDDQMMLVSTAVFTL